MQNQLRVPSPGLRPPSHQGRENPVVYMPQQVAIELVRGCNFFCTMCPVPAGTAEHRWQFMELEMIERLCQEIRQYPSIHTVWYFGFGEPLAHPQFEETLAILHRAIGELEPKIAVVMHTNASLLNGSKAQALLEIPVVSKLVFSFDGLGDKASYEAMRGPHFDAVLDNIRVFSAEAKRQRPDLQLSTCSIVPRPVDAVDFVETWPEQTVIDARYQALFEPIGVRVETRNLHNYSGDLDLKVHGGVGQTAIGGCPHIENDYLFFQVSGNTQPCCASFSEKLSLGNVHESTFKHLLNNSKTSHLRHHLRLDDRSVDPVCSSCTLSLNTLSPAARLDYWRARDAKYPMSDPAERAHLLGNR